MTVKPILFSRPMVRAILDGRKTQDRRVLKPQPDFVYDKLDRLVNVNGLAAQASPPPYAPGDMLWVRENIYQFGGPVEYPADGPPSFQRKLTPSIHMPRWASRLTLEVESVKVERVQDISGYDAYWEGVCQSKTGHDAGHPSYTIEMFRRLWDSLNAKRGFGWEANPWVVAITFKPHHCNVDALPERKESG